MKGDLRGANDAAGGSGCGGASPQREANMTTRRSFLRSGAAATATLAIRAWPAHAENAPGVTDTEIKIGQTMAYSGPASAYGVAGRAEAAYFRMINEKGGVNGRKMSFISLDDGYSPSNTIEQTRRLVEQEGVAFIFGSLGDPTALAVRQYLNDNKIPQLFVAALAESVTDPEHYPWTIAMNNASASEAHVYAKYILATKPNARIGVLIQNDPVSKIFLRAIREGLGGSAASMIVKEVSFEVTDPTVDSQVITLQASGADTFIIAAAAKGAAQAIRKTYDLGWTPDRFVINAASSIVAVMKPAGLEKSKGVITAGWGKDPNDPRWKDDPGVKEWEAFAAKYLTAADSKDIYAFYGYHVAIVMVHVLKQCGNDLSRDNVLRQALSIKDFTTPVLLPGITINTSPTNYLPVRQFQMQRFNGENWELFGDVLND
jgi:branched-chain amino acid transport system substrate-binding protein